MEPMNESDSKLTQGPKAVVVLSGGLDSTTLLYDVGTHGFRPYAFSVRYGQRHVKELQFAGKTCERLGVTHTVIDIPTHMWSTTDAINVSALTSDLSVPHGHYEAENMKQTVVPNRNMILLSLAGAYAISIGAKHLFYGAHTGDHMCYPDCRPSFISAMTDAFKVCSDPGLEFHAPYQNMTKYDILSHGMDLDVDFDLTWSCYEGKELACGKCGTCVERISAFMKFGMNDPIPYEDPWDVLVKRVTELEKTAKEKK